MIRWIVRLNTKNQFIVWDNKNNTQWDEYQAEQSALDECNRLNFRERFFGSNVHAA